MVALALSFLGRNEAGAWSPKAMTNIRQVKQPFQTMLEREPLGLG
jgi:hypothetical protein